MTTRQKQSEKSSARDSLARARVVFNAIAAVVALAGLADATYLTVAHLAGDNSVCGPSQPCSIVLGSAYAQIAGIPTAAFGAIAYFAVFSAATLAGFGYTRARIFLMGIVAVMFAATTPLRPTVTRCSLKEIVPSMRPST